MMTIAPLAAVAAEGQGSSSPEATVREATAALTAEAKQLDKLIADTDPQPKFERLHPKLKGLSGDAAPVALEAMGERFTGNPYRDTYVRWHLMHVVRKAGPGGLRGEGEKLVTLIQAMPGALKKKLKRYRIWRPKEIASQYFKRRRQTRTIVGYPPFERR